jgi:hypothetical protein
VFVRVQRAAFIGGGRDNVVENNIFIDCRPAVQVDGRGLDRSPVWHDMVYTTMKERLDLVRHHEPPYSVRYPELKALDGYYASGVGVPPEGNRIRRNICVGAWIQAGWHAREDMLDVRDNLVGPDPGFRNATALDFSLKDDSPARGIGFEEIPFARIGLPREGAGPGRVRRKEAERDAKEVQK